MMLRRSVLRTLVAGAAMAMLPRSARACVGALRSRFALERWLAALGHRASAVEIGRAYLMSHPGKTTGWDGANVLRRIARAGSCDDLKARCSDAESMRQRLREIVCEDFAEGRVVWLGGWLLSETEAQLCALAALSEWDDR